MRRSLMLLPLILIACQGAGAGTQHAATRPATAPAIVRLGDYTTPAAKLMKAGKYREALKAAEAELAAVRAKKTDRPAMLAAIGLVADLQSKLGHYREADALYGEGIASLKDGVPGDALYLAKFQNDLAELRYVTAKWDEAVDLAKKSLEARKKLLPADHPDLADSLTTCGFMLTGTPKPPTGEDAVKKSHEDLVAAWKIRVAALGADSAEVADSYNSLGLFFLENEVEDNDVFPDAADDDARVQRCLNKALDIRKRALPADHPDIAESLVNIAAFNLRRERLDDAARDATAGLAILEKALGAGHPDVAYTLNVLGEVRQQQGRVIEAESHFKRAEKIYSEAFDANHYFVGTVLRNLASLYADLGDKAKVQTVQKRLDRIFGRQI